jgi:hypothetical protein
MTIVMTADRGAKPGWLSLLLQADALLILVLMAETEPVRCRDWQWMGVCELRRA